MRVLSLFDGISCGRVALERAGIKVSCYYASEIDKYAEAVSKKNYPDIIRLGDVREIDFSLFIGKIDLIIGGSPCQDLSIAKHNRQGLSGERSGLFWRFVEAIEIIKPKYFMLENVASMSKENKELITRTLGVEPILINSALVSAQQRKRLYWCNWVNELPKDKGILLQDILETGEAWNYKSHCLTANYTGAVFPHDFLRHQRQMVAEPTGCALRTRENSKHLEIRKDEKSNAMTSSRTDSMVCLYSRYNQSTYKNKSASIGTNSQCETAIAGQVVIRPVRLGSLGKPSQGNRVYSVKGKSVCLSALSGGKGAKTGLYKIDLPDGDYIVRKLTPLECERLQTLPEGYTSGVSNTQRYKTIGNGWTVDVISHLFSKLE